MKEPGAALDSIDARNGQPALTSVPRVADALLCGVLIGLLVGMIAFAAVLWLWVIPAMRDALGIDPCTSFHSLRHTHATWLLIAGVDPKTVSERLGHGSVATTLRLYAHVLPGRDAQAAEGFAAVARGMGDCDGGL